MNLAREHLQATTRRHFFRESGTGLGAMGLASLLNGNLFAAESGPMAARVPHFAPKAKRVIYLFMNGAPSQLDLFDNKPKLVEHNGNDVPAEYVKNERFAFIKGTPKLLGSPYKFARHGQSGTEFSTLLPHLAGVADDLAVVRSGVTDAFNHAPAQIFLNTGSTQIAGRAWAPG